MTIKLAFSNPLRQCFSNHGSQPKSGLPRLCEWVAKACKLPHVKEKDLRAQDLRFKVKTFFLEITTFDHAQSNIFGSQLSLQIVVFSDFGSQKKRLEKHCFKGQWYICVPSSSSFKEYPLQVRRKQDCGQGFILLLPQTAALPESDAGSDVIKPALSFVIQNRQTSCSMLCPMYKARC